MRKLSVAFLFLALFGAAAAHAQSCSYCWQDNPYYSNCTSLNGRWANCYQICDSVACSCHMNMTAGRCTLDGDGLYSFKTYYNIRFVRPEPLESQFRVVSVT